MDSKLKDLLEKINMTQIKKVMRKIDYYFEIFFRVIKGVLGYLILILIVLGALAGGAAVGYFNSLVEEAPPLTSEEMGTKVHDYIQKSTLYYADNSKISDLRSDLLRTPIALDEISPWIINSLIATEDENFYHHEGIVPKALVRAAVQELSGAESVTGGSTITQQLIKQQILTSDVTHSRKAVEILYATNLEDTIDKDDILLAYMNVSPFGRNNLGRNIAGIEEAAQGIFGVSALDVNLPQAAFLAGLPKSPISYNPYTQNGEIKEDVSAGISRQNEVLYNLRREGYITQDVYEEALAYDISEDFLKKSSDDGSDSSHSYVYDLVEKESRKIIMNMLLTEDEIDSDELIDNPELKEKYYNQADVDLRNKGYKIYSTIDPELHHAIENKIKDTKDSFGPMRTVNYTDDDGEAQTIEYETQVSGTLIENETGRVLSFVGGRDYEYSEFNIAFDSRRGSGSAIKPLITYGPALAENFITPATIIPDTKLVVPDGSGTHNINNVGSTTNDWRDARHWLKVSQNIPNTKIYLEMLKNNIDPSKYMRAMGINESAISDDEFGNASTSLGGFTTGPTNMELSAAYATIGNGGVFNQPYVIEKIEDENNETIYEHETKSERVWSEATNYLLYDMLRDVSRSGTGASTRSYLNFDVDLASKTGTTDDTVDVWYAGVTPKVSYVSWMGYDDQNLSLTNFNGLAPSARNIRNWANVMNEVYNVKPELLGLDQRVQPPSDGSVTSATVLQETGMKSGNVSVPGSGNIKTSGKTKSELFNKENIPGSTVYDFAVGAKDSELKEFWNKDIKRREDKKKKEEKEKKEKEQKEKEQKEKEQKEKEEKEKKEQEKKEKERKEQEEKEEKEKEEAEED